MMKWIRSVIEKKQDLAAIHNTMGSDNMEKLKDKKYGLMIFLKMTGRTGEWPLQLEIT